MDKSLINRLEALEVKDSPPWRLVIWHDGESEEQARKRAGVRPGEAVIFVSQQDEAL